MILVTGATGNVGRRLVELLDDAGVPVRAISRSPHTAGLPTRVDVVAGDPARPQTIRDALRGVSAVFLNPRAVAGSAPELLALAAAQGVRQVVVLSAINVEDDPARQPYLAMLAATVGRPARTTTTITDVLGRPAATFAAWAAEHADAFRSDLSSVVPRS